MLLRLFVLLGLFAAIVSLESCFEDNCTEEMTYMGFVPQYTDAQTIRNGVQLRGPEIIKSPGKIYKKGDYLFINEPDRGIHIFDNSNPSGPVNLSFLAIPGNVDIAVLGNVLYADSYIDLLVFDLTSTGSPVLLKRLEAVFPQRSRENSLQADDSKGIVTSFKEEEITEVLDCDVARNRRWIQEDVLSSTIGGGAENGPNLSGIAGSLARFGIVDKVLYALNTTSLRAFNLNVPNDPVFVRDIQIGFNMETIFPYQGYLFMGSETGMFIYSGSNPYNPTYVGQFNHLRGCDPVAVEGNRAYVTIRSRATRCQGSLNQLDVLDISTLTNPQLMRSYQMYNPHGVGIENSTLFVCDKEEGLKVYDASDSYRIDQNLLGRKQIQALDVIPDGGELIAIAEDGIYQYDYSNPNDIKLLSKIDISP